MTGLIFGLTLTAWPQLVGMECGWYGSGRASKCGRREVWRQESSVQLNQNENVGAACLNGASDFRTSGLGFLHCQWCRRRACRGASELPIDLICSKSGQTSWKLGKNPWKSVQTPRKSGQKWRQTLSVFEKWRPRFAEQHTKTFFANAYHNTQFVAVGTWLDYIPANVVSYSTVWRQTTISNLYTVNFVCKLRQHFSVDNIDIQILQWNSSLA